MVESALALLVVFNVGMRFAVRAGYRLPLLSAMNACLRLGSRISYQGRMPGHDPAAPGSVLHSLFLACIGRTSNPETRDKLRELDDTRLLLRSR